jgi:hypothetical protein
VGKTSVKEDGAWRCEVEFLPGSHVLLVRLAGGKAQSTLQPVSVVPAPAGESRCPAGHPPPGKDRGDAYVVARCETIRLVAARAGVNVQDILAANPEVCNPNLIYVGQVLKLPPRE